MSLDLLFLALSRRRVVPLYTRVDALRPTESRSTHTNVSSSVTSLTCLTLQVLFIHGGLYLRALSRLWAWAYKPYRKSSPCILFGLPLVNPPLLIDLAPPGRVIPGSYIPNIRPQVDLNFVLVNLQYLEKIHLLLFHESLVTRHDVISGFFGNPPPRHLLMDLYL